MKVFNCISCSILLAAAFIAVSCSGNALETGGMNKSELRFSPVVGTMSSKAIIEGNTFPDESFSVSAVLFGYRDSSGNIDYTKPQELFLNADAVKNEYGNWAFGSKEKYYWPHSGAMLFWGIYPASQTMSDMNLHTGISMNPDYTAVVHDYTIKHSTGAPDYTPIETGSNKTEDNLYAGKMDFMYASYRFEDVGARTSDVVPMVFEHNLAMIQFFAKSARDYSICDYRKADGTAGTADDYDHVNINHVRMRIEKLSLGNIFSKGEYSTIVPHWKDSDLKDPYNYVLLDRRGENESIGTELVYDCGDGEDPRDDCDDYIHFGGRTPYAVPVTNTSEDTPIATLMIPQRLHSSAVLNVTYTLRQENKREYNNGDLKEADPGYRSSYLLNDYSGTITRSLNLPEITPVWAIATKYIYTIVVGLDDIELNAEYVNWNTGETEEDVL